MPPIAAIMTVTADMGRSANDSAITTTLASTPTMLLLLSETPASFRIKVAPGVAAFAAPTSTPILGGRCCPCTLVAAPLPSGDRWKGLVCRCNHAAVQCLPITTRGSFARYRAAHVPCASRVTECDRTAHTAQKTELPCTAVHCKTVLTTSCYKPTACQCPRHIQHTLKQIVPQGLCPSSQHCEALHHPSKLKVIIFGAVDVCISWTKRPVQAAAMQ